MAVAGVEVGAAVTEEEEEEEVAVADMVAADATGTNLARGQRAAQ